MTSRRYFYALYQVIRDTQGNAFDERYITDKDTKGDLIAWYNANVRNRSNATKQAYTHNSDKFNQCNNNHKIYKIAL